MAMSWEVQDSTGHLIVTSEPIKEALNVFWQHATNLRYDGLHWNLNDRVSGEVSWQYTV